MSAATERAGDVAALLSALVASDPGRPRLTWYGADGDRVELSARVLGNWVVKTANLLADDLDAEPGCRVRLDLPPHWRSVVWWLAVGATGGEVDTGDGGEADVVVTTAPGPGVVVTLPALARSAGPLPPGSLDYNAAVGGQPDELMVLGDPAPLPDPQRRWAPGTRLLLTVAPGARHGATGGGPVPAGGAAHRVAVVVLDALRADGSVVLVGEGGPTGDALDALAAQEQVTQHAAAC